MKPNSRVVQCSLAPFVGPGSRPETRRLPSVPSVNAKRAGATVKPLQGSGEGFIRAQLPLFQAETLQSYAKQAGWMSAELRATAQQAVVDFS